MFTQLCFCTLSLRLNFSKNCTYCGGQIEDNYPPAAVALGRMLHMQQANIVHSQFRIYCTFKPFFNSNTLSWHLRSLDSIDRAIINFDEIFKVFCFRCASVSHRNNILLHDEGEAVCQVQQKLLLNLDTIRRQDQTIVRDTWQIFDRQNPILLNNKHIGNSKDYLYKSILCL